VEEYHSITQSQHDNDNVNPCLVFGSLGPLLESYRADKIMDHDAGVRVYHTMVSALAPYVDAFLAETLSSIEEAMQVVEAVAMFNMNNHLDLPLLISFTVNSEGQLRSGESAPNAFSHILRTTYNPVENPRPRILAFLFNCSEPECISLALQHVNDDLAILQLLEKHNIVLGAYANRLTPVPSDWTLDTSNTPQPYRDDLDPQHYHDSFVEKWVNSRNVKIIGGCCAMTPKHIAYLRSKFKSC
jgi:S-methylmethionine-dependent homocysteine/selenocysteine methylase